MLGKKDMIVGKFYVYKKRKIAREVLRTGKQTITFNTYHLDTGNSCGSPSECTVQDFMRWANDEASPAELNLLQDKNMEEQFY